MSTTRERSSVAAVSDEVGKRIRERRTRLGMDVKPLAERAGVDRGRLAKIEAGTATNVRTSTIGAIERALDELEAERRATDAALPPGVSQIGDPADDLFAVEVYTDAGVLRAVVKGQPKDADVIRETAQQLMAGMALEPPKANDA